MERVGIQDWLLGVVGRSVALRREALEVVSGPPEIASSLVAVELGVG